MKRLFLVLLFCIGFAHAETLTGRVVGVADGDTLTLLVAGDEQVKIRLAQIDAPEKKQAFGERSKQSLSALVFGKTVRVEVESKDRYGRSVGTVWAGKLDVNLEQVRRGLAWVYVKYAHDQNYYAIQADAKAKGVGVWSDTAAMPPWEWRKAQRKGKT